MTISLGGLALVATSANWFEWTVFFLMIIATVAALHDVAVERLYSVRLLYTIVQGSLEYELSLICCCLLL